MRFATTLVLAATSAAASAWHTKSDISIETQAGKTLLSKARKLDQVSQGWSYGYSRNENGYNYNDVYNNYQNNKNYQNYQNNQNDQYWDEGNQQWQNRNYQNYQYNNRGEDWQYNNGYDQMNGEDYEGQQQGQDYNEENYDYEGYYENRNENRVNANWGNDVNADYDLSWMPGYSIKFDGCASELVEGSTELRLLAKFKLCPSSSSCRFCRHAGEYIVPMADFVAAYEDVLLSDDSCAMQQKQCSQQCENGEYQQDDDDDAAAEGEEEQAEDDQVDDGYSCFSECMGNSTSCESNQENSQQFNLANMVTCQALDSNDSSERYYVGAICKNGGVYLETFTDSSCSKPAADDTFETLTGTSLPDQNLVSSDCIECSSGGNENYQSDADGSGSSSGVCQELYSEAGKCEKNMKDLPFKNNGACDYIHGTLARLNRDAGSFAKSALKYFAWFLGAGCLIMVAYVFYLLRKRSIKRASKSALIPGKTLDEPLTPPDNDGGSETDADSTYKGAEIPAADGDGQAVYQGGQLTADEEEPKKETQTPSVV